MFSVVFLVINPQPGNEFLWMFHLETRRWQILSYTALLGIPFVLPAIFTVVCAVLICIFLLRKRSTTKAQGQNRSITVTVLLLTFSSLLFSCLYFVTEFALAFYNPNVRILKYEYYLLYFAGNVSVFLNSVIKPAILMTRGTSLRDYLRVKCTHTMSKGLSSLSSFIIFCAESIFLRGISDYLKCSVISQILINNFNTD